VVVVTAHRDPAWAARATQAGASAFVPKNGSLEEMQHARMSWQTSFSNLKVHGASVRSREH
jgi:DNA-binding NarL/FixJ family response regulator